ncbi:hypothetical protein Pve01_00380 [Planomonospora venezuelensis]|nr:hypothetical protein Pve01_00380 [Planomonospora venezuelensis]
MQAAPPITPRSAAAGTVVGLVTGMTTGAVVGAVVGGRVPRPGARPRAGREVGASASLLWGIADESMTGGNLWTGLS